MNTLGGDRPARDIGPSDIVPHLVSIYDRGAATMANKVRCFIGSAFAFGLASTHDYTRKSDGADWGLYDEPGRRHQGRYRSSSDPRPLPVAARIPRVLGMALRVPGKERVRGGATTHALDRTKDRGSLRIGHESSYSPRQKMVTWEKTKNGLPHAIPLPRQACEILDREIPNRHGLYFPHKHKPTEPAPYDSVERLITLFITETGCEHFMPRDVRRTWKTLAGRGGLSKDIRDRIQNHSKSGDVSSRHYDRYEYLSEKRAAMEQWGRFLDRILAGELLDEQQPATITGLNRAA